MRKLPIVFLFRNTLACVVVAALIAFPYTTSRAGVEVHADKWGQLAHKIFAELIAIDTTHDSGDTTPAAELLARYLRDGGFQSEDVQVLGPRSRNKNLVAKLRGKGASLPIVLFAHLDVVAAPRGQWNSDPFALTERNGYFYGRGAFDVKNEAADLVTNLIRLKREGYETSRDIVIALTAGEEAGADYNGIAWLLENRKELINAEYAINLDSGDAHNRKGLHAIFGYNLDEKTFLSWRLSAQSPGGHSDQPSPDNAIARIASAVDRVHQTEFPVHLTSTARGYLRSMATVESGQLAADMIALADARNEDITVLARRVAAGSPEYNAQLRTTCVPTIIKGGFALNALPTEAEAFINCRILPDDSYESVYEFLRRAIADEKVRIDALQTNGEIVGPSALPPRPAPQPSRPDLEAALEQVVTQMWPGVPVVPVLQIGASDSLALRRAGIPSYGVQGMFFDIEDANQQHGPNERVGMREFFEGVEFTNRLMRALTQDVKVR